MADPDALTVEFIEENLRKFVTPGSLETLSRKAARRELEKQLGFGDDGLKGRRGDINSVLDKLVEEFRPVEDEVKTESRESEGGESENESEVNSKVGVKTGATPTSEIPKNLKKLQASMMSKADFLAGAQSLQTRVSPDLSFSMIPRQFSSGSCGWYFGGKLQMPVGDKRCWCQMNMLCTVMGSGSWPTGTDDSPEDSDEKPESKKKRRK
eukprot:GHVT01080589.1.p1 GENE.GHVT01080589.1~~GHVT01080589.1.p1  ORF type:complete len:210 (+),score=28.16 GHVT01080589.1:924-1553(+)